MEIFAPSNGRSIVYLLPLPLILDENSLELTTIAQKLLSTTQSSVCLTLYGHGLGSESVRSRDEEAFLLRRTITRFPIERLLLSSGVTFKTHLSAYGGHGYSGLFTQVLSNLPSEVTVQITRENPKRLLMWRPRPVAEPEKPKPTWQCRFCQGKFEETHQKFEKMDFEYCSMKCLSGHR